MEILILLFLLQVKHYYADFVIQTYAQTVHKGIYRDLCGISHSMDHIWTSLVVLLIFSLVHPVSIGTMLVATAIEGIIHYHIDWVKVRFGIKDQTKPLFWNQFGADQLAHQITYIAMVAWILF